MPKKLIDFPGPLFDHIESFRRHFGIKTEGEAVRTLILDAFKFHGCPLEISPKLLMGRPAHKETENVLKEKENHQKRYDELMRQMGFNKETEY